MFISALNAIVGKDPTFHIRRAAGARLSFNTAPVGLQLLNELGAANAGRWDQLLGSSARPLVPAASSMLFFRPSALGRAESVQDSTSRTAHGFILTANNWDGMGPTNICFCMYLPDAKGVEGCRRCCDEVLMC